MVWQDARSGSTYDIYGARVAADGAVLDGPTDTGGIAICTEAIHQVYPSVAWSGANYVVGWADSRIAQYEYDIYAGRVSPAGSLLDGSGIPVAAMPPVINEWMPSFKLELPVF